MQRKLLFHQGTICALCKENYSPSARPVVLACGCCNQCERCVEAKKQEAAAEGNNNDAIIRCALGHEIPVDAPTEINTLLMDLVLLSAELEKTDVVQAAQEAADQTDATKAKAVMLHSEKRIQDDQFASAMLLDLAKDALAYPKCFFFVATELRRSARAFELEEYGAVALKYAAKIEQDGNAWQAADATSPHKGHHHHKHPQHYSLAVCDTENKRVLICRTNGIVLRELGAGQLTCPVAVDTSTGGRVGVVDSGSNRIVVYDTNKAVGELEPVIVDCSRLVTSDESSSLRVSHMCFVRHNAWSEIAVVMSPPPPADSSSSSSSPSSSSARLLLINYCSSNQDEMLRRTVDLPIGAVVDAIASVTHTECVFAAMSGAIHCYDLKPTRNNHVANRTVPYEELLDTSGGSVVSAMRMPQFFDSSASPIKSAYATKLLAISDESKGVRVVHVVTDDEGTAAAASTEIDDNMLSPTLRSQLPTIVPLSARSVATGGLAAKSVCFVGYADDYEDRESAMVNGVSQDEDTPMSPTVRSSSLEIAVADRVTKCVAVMRTCDGKVMQSLSQTTNARFVKTPVSVAMILR